MKLIYAIAVVGLVAIVGLLCQVLPESPFVQYTILSEFSPYLKYINYFIPLDKIVALSEIWLAAVAVFFNVKLADKAIRIITDIVPL